MRIIMVCVLCISFISCYEIYTEPTALELACALTNDCVHGTAITDYKTYSNGETTYFGCFCKCDQGWCGKSCNINLTSCKGKISYNVDDETCSCKCKYSFTLPPNCSDLRIPFLETKHLHSAVNENDYFPLQLDNRWIFVQQDEMGVDTAEFGMVIGDELPYFDTTMYALEFIIPDTTNNFISDTSLHLGGMLLYNDPSDPDRVMRWDSVSLQSIFAYHSFQHGDTLLIDGDQYFSDSIGNVTVPAGSFDNCYYLYDEFDSGFIFAPGVGWIANLDEGDTIAVLKEYDLSCNFNAKLTIINPNCYDSNEGQLIFSSDTDESTFTFEWGGNTMAGDTSVATDLSPGLYSLTVRTGNCIGQIDSIPIDAPEEIIISDIDVSHADCDTDNGAIQLEVSGGTGPLAYDWNSGQYTTRDISDLAPGCYELTVIDSLGCQKSTKVEIMSGAISVDTEIIEPSCYNEATGSIMTTPTGGMPPYTFFWNTGDTTVQLTDLAAGIYALTVTDDVGCSFDSVFVLNTPEVLVVDLSNINNPSCSESDNGLLQVEATGGTLPYAYMWSTGDTSNVIEGLSGGIFTLTVEDANACRYEAEYELSDPLPIAVQPIEVKHPDCAGDNNGAIELEVMGGTPPFIYNWNDDFAMELNLSDLPEGEYELTITDSNLCEMYYNTSLISPEPLSGFATTNNLSCFEAMDGFVEFKVEGGTPPYQYDWDSGDATAAINDLTAGTYHLTITDANDCTSENEVVISQPESLDVDLSVSNEITCFDMMNGSISAMISGGTPPYIYAWSNGASGADFIDNLDAALYMFTLTDSNGCAYETDLQLEQPDPLQGEISSQNSVDGLPNGWATITVEGGTPPYSYAWSDQNFQMTDTAFALVPGIYTVTVTDANGCMFSEEVEVGQTTDVQDINTAVLQGYPNPAESFFYIQMPSATDVDMIRIVGSSGKVVLLPPIESLTPTLSRIDLSRLNSGVYFVAITLGQQQKYIRVRKL